MKSFIFIAAVWSLSQCASMCADKKGSLMQTLANAREMSALEASISNVCSFRDLSLKQIEDTYTSLPDAGPEASPAVRNALLNTPGVLKSWVTSGGAEKLYAFDRQGDGIDVLVRPVQAPFKMVYAESASTWAVKVSKTALPAELVSSLPKLVETLFSLPAGGEFRNDPLVSKNDCFVAKDHELLHPFLRIIFVSNGPSEITFLGFKASMKKPVLLDSRTESGWFESFEKKK